MFTLHPVFQMIHPVVVLMFIIRPGLQTLALILTRRQSKSKPIQSEISVIDPSFDSKVFSVDASNTADDLSVSAHLQ